jgi:hypothetical protein
VADKGPVTDAIRLPMAFDENSGRVLLFSATQSGTCMPGSTWAWDGVAWSLVSAGEGPVWMRGSLFFHDDIARPMIVDVGFHCDAGPADQKVGDLWDWDGSAWNARAASPGPEGEGIAAYDPFFREVVFLSANPVPRAVSFGTDTWTWKWGTCLSDSDCTTGPCEDGVCCDRACGGSDPADCQACSIAAGALTNGTCGPVVAGRICRRAMGEHPALLCTGSSEECPEPPVPPAPEPEMDAGDDATRVGEATVALRAGGGCTMRADGGRNAHGIGAAVLLVLVAVRRRPSVKRHEVRASEGSWR